MDRFRIRTLFLRSGWLAYVALALYIFIHVYLIHCVSSADSYGSATAVIDTQGAGIFVFLLGGFLAYEFCNMEKACGLSEALFVDHRIKRKFWRKKIALLLAIVLICGITVFIYDVYLMAMANALVPAVVVRLLCANLLDIVFVGLIAVFLGAVLALRFERAMSYAVLVVFTVLASPLAKLWAGLIPIAYMLGIEFDAMRIIDLFSVTIPDTNWVADLMYFVPLESCRWFLALFWLALLGMLLSWRLWYKKARICRVTILTALAVIGLFGFLRMGNDSVVRLDDRLQGTINRDMTYWDTHEQKEEEAAFSVLSYDIALRIRARMTASVSMEISKNEESDRYIFTLYRGYKISSVTDVDGNALAYERDGNYLEVTYPFEGETGTLIITYQGNGNKYFSNYQGVALPGYFSWYPRAGYLNIWDEDQSCNIILEESEQKTFTLAVDTFFPMTLVSNLEETQTNQFSGSATTLTLVGGLLSETESDGIAYYSSLIKDDNSLYSLERIQETIDTVEEMLGVSFGIQLSELKIISMPNTIYRNGGDSQNETFVVLEDHLLMAGNGMSMTYAAVKSLVPYKQEAQCLRELLISYLWNAETSAIYAETSAKSIPDYDVLMELENYYNQGEFAEADGLDELYEQLLQYQLSAYGETYVLQACYEYLCSDSEQNEVDFLYYLESAEEVTE